MGEVRVLLMRISCDSHAQLAYVGNKPFKRGTISLWELLSGVLSERPLRRFGGLARAILRTVRSKRAFEHDGRRDPRLDRQRAKDWGW